MKITRQTRIFARQVQVDLLALSNADLFQMVHHWVVGTAAGPAYEVSDVTKSSLGYAPEAKDEDTNTLIAPLESHQETGMPWLAPTQLQLRELLTQMDIKDFAQHVLPLAFEAMHIEHPEWGEGATFNAHLANHLRLISTKR